MTVPAQRVRALNDAAVRGDGKYVLYWMVANRRTHFNFSLQHAIDRCRELAKPLLILEALRCDYRWASLRFHRFILDGMEDNARRFERAPVSYYPYVEPESGAGKGLLAALGRHACAVVTDDFPCFMIPKMIEAGARQVGVLAEAVDSNGWLPIRAADRLYPTAYAFRRFLQRELPSHLDAFPKPDPLSRLRLPALPRLPDGVARRWPKASRALRGAGAEALRRLPIDASVEPVVQRGGAQAGRATLKRFRETRLSRYASDRNCLAQEATSGLSAYLHFGQLSTHQVGLEILTREDWAMDRLSEQASGGRLGWWGLSEEAETFLDQLVTWRELGFNACARSKHYSRYASLPSWALETLERHSGDEREHLYSLEAFERAETHDPLWNAAQRQLLREGRIHNYLRMLWGKKILHWSRSPRAALAVMVELNNKYALDGRDPNSYSGIFWTLGRYDRPWGPERPIFGKVRYMSSDNTARKLDVRPYLARYGVEGDDRRGQRSSPASSGRPAAARRRPASRPAAGDST